MPIYEYVTEDGEKVEMIFSVKERPQEIVSSRGRVAKLCVSLVANTPRKWGDSHEKPYFSHALGRMVNGKKHADAIAKSKGYIPACELGSESEANRIMDSVLDKQLDVERQDQKSYDTYQNIAHSDGPQKAEEWFTHKTLHALE